MKKIELLFFYIIFLENLKNIIFLENLKNIYFRKLLFLEKLKDYFFDKLLIILFWAISLHIF